MSTGINEVLHHAMKVQQLTETNSVGITMNSDRSREILEITVALTRASWALAACMQHAILCTHPKPCLKVNMYGIEAGTAVLPMYTMWRLRVEMSHCHQDSWPPFALRDCTSPLQPQKRDAGPCQSIGAFSNHATSGQSKVA
eukprot:gnl/MRDRNA2_/MRDRNA2_28527_c0_seq1.p1 gnl/MRDRNA2_/MRDRNA2_28527_c0~~gnl/MRDRNA2_/MRDRNA2_28527_c0_seq1.p1  ORF type:complete len:142 (-),score=11.55 gnl/MRDRNA2_/MRDRNA2_28527_c0_seq1:120-545(-)